MTGITLRIDADRWRQHLRSLTERVPGLIPVAKGNGYGFGLPMLCAEAASLGLPTVAVGTPAEAETVLELSTVDLVMLLPWDSNDPRAVELARNPRVILTVSRLNDLEILANLGGNKPRVLVEVLTTMKRHGIPSEDLPALEMWTDALQVEGWTVHLPLAGQQNLNEAEHLGRLARDVVDAPVWYSHLTLEDYATINQRMGADRTRLRLGTQLWLGHPGALSTTATVLDVHPVRRGDRMGYWQRPAPMDGFVVVVSGGTANGIGLEAPSSVKNLRQRAISLATGALESAGLALSPYTISGQKRWFVEPPHMQSALVFLPKNSAPPEVGDEIPVEVRNTIANFDQIMLEEAHQD